MTFKNILTELDGASEGNSYPHFFYARFDDGSEFWHGLKEEEYEIVKKILSECPASHLSFEGSFGVNFSRVFCWTLGSVCDD